MINKGQALELRLVGKTYQEIADIYGVSRQRIHQKLTGYKPKSYQAYRREHNRIFRQTERGKVQHRQAQRRLRAKAKLLVLTHYGDGKCACVMCGYNNIKALSIDHTNGLGAKHKKQYRIKSGDGIYRWLIKQGYPNGYQTLCMNCQFIKRHNNNECHRFIVNNTPFATP